jgi:phosphatidylinositol glycan class O
LDHLPRRGLNYTTTQLTGDLVLALAAVSLVAHFEVVDSVRDVRMMEVLAASNPSAVLDATAVSRSPPIRFADIVSVALLVLLTFYGTGHQSNLFNPVEVGIPAHADDELQFVGY